ncbi:phage tail protein [Streptomyces sp. NPDC085927]|uniref:phage tail protein n=1 Tax=Streptomyces sp. NPDC085927 TaxID=3365738 RepID=UPI0037D80A06
MTVTGEPIVCAQPGPPKSGEITLSRPRNVDHEFVEWVTTSSQKPRPGETRQNICLAVLDANKNAAIRFQPGNARGSEWSCPDLPASDTRVTVERVTIVYRSITVV